MPHLPPPPAGREGVQAPPPPLFSHGDDRSVWLVTSGEELGEALASELRDDGRSVARTRLSGAVATAASPPRAPGSLLLVPDLDRHGGRVEQRADHDELLALEETVRMAWRCGVERVALLVPACVYPHGAASPLREDELTRGEPPPTHAACGQRTRALVMKARRARGAGRDVRIVVVAEPYGVSGLGVAGSLVDAFERAVRAGADVVRAPMPAGARYDLLHLRDLARGVGCVLDRRDPPAVVNLGSGTQVRAEELAAMVADAVGWEGTFRFAGTREGAALPCLDVSRATGLGWEPRVPVISGIRALVEAAKVAEAAPGPGDVRPASPGMAATRSASDQYSAEGDREPSPPAPTDGPRPARPPRDGEPGPTTTSATAVPGWPGGGEADGPRRPAEPDPRGAGGGPSLPGAAAERWTEGPGLLESIWRHRWIVAAAGILVGAIGYGLSAVQPVTYQATARMFLAGPESRTVFGSRDPGVSQETYLLQQGERVTSAEVIERAAGAIDGVSPGQLRERVRVSTDPQLLALRVTATGPTGELASRGANSVAEAYEAVSRERVRREAEAVIQELEEAQAALQDRIDQVQGQLAGEGDPVGDARLQSLVGRLLELENRAQQARVDAEVTGSGVEVVEPAGVPGSPASPQPRRAAAVGLVLGLALGGAIAYWLAGRAGVVLDQKDPEPIFGAPLLAAIPPPRRPRAEHLAQDLSEDPLIAESYQFLLTSVEFGLARIGGRSVLITSPDVTQGKTTTVLRLAVAALRDGRDVVLVDGDLRARTLSTLLGVADKPGLQQLAAGRDVDDLLSHVRLEDLTLSVLGAGEGSRDTTAALRAPGFREGMQQLSGAGELIVVDSAPLLAVADTTVLAGQVDGIVLIVPRGTPLRMLQQTCDRLRFVAAPVIGYVYVGPDAEITTPYFIDESWLARRQRVHRSR